MFLRSRNLRFFQIRVHFSGWGSGQAPEIFFRKISVKKKIGLPENQEIFFFPKSRFLWFFKFLLFFCVLSKPNMFWKWSNMAHDKIYFPEKKPVCLIKIQKGSWEYSKIICERMKVITILI